MKMEVTPKTIFFGLAAAYLAGMLVLTIFKGVGGIENLKPVFSNASSTDAMMKCQSPEFQNLDICKVGRVQGDNLVQNGSFEMPGIFADTQSLPYGTEGLGWGISLSSSSVSRGLPVQLMKGAAGAGTQYAKLLSSGGNVDYLGQRVATSAKTNYTLAFQSLDSELSCLAVKWGGKEVARIQGQSSSGWTYHTYTVSGNSGETLLEFGACSPAGASLDGVSLVQM